MKRLQISLEPELDDRLTTEAERQGISKAMVVRRSLEQTFDSPAPIAEDPFFSAFGTFNEGGLRPGETVDDVVYGQRRDEG